jgi:hypothetical protein
MPSVSKQLVNRSFRWQTVIANLVKHDNHIADAARYSQNGGQILRHFPIVPGFHWPNGQLKRRLRN